MYRALILLVVAGCPTPPPEYRQPLVLAPRAELFINRATPRPTGVCREREAVLVIDVEVINRGAVASKRGFVGVAALDSSWGGGDPLPALAPGEMHTVQATLYYPPGSHELVVRGTSFSVHVTNPNPVAKSVVHAIEPPCRPEPVSPRSS